MSEFWLYAIWPFTFPFMVNAMIIARMQGPIFYPTGKHQSADLGKALAPLERGRGLIPVLLTLR